MSAAMPSTARQQYPAASTWRLPSPGQRPRRRILVHPLTVICAVQAALSLSLVWSNTAYIDEAELSLDRVILRSHIGYTGPSWPRHTQKELFSGSPVIYPPLGAFADSIGGLVGARILSLHSCSAQRFCSIFTASRLIGP